MLIWSSFSFLFSYLPFLSVSLMADWLAYFVELKLLAIG